MKLIPLTRGKFAQVDDEDYVTLSKYKWTLCKGKSTFYAMRSVMTNGIAKTIYMHRFILNISDRDVHVDHKDHNGLNNQRNNIRIGSRQNNAQNRRSLKNKTSSFVGVSLDKRGRWVAQIDCKYIGRFLKEEDAAKAYDEKAKNLHGEFACLNFPNK